MGMKTLLSLVIICCTSLLQAANPAFTDFYGTNGIIIRTNGNKVQVDGAALASTNSIANANIWTNSLGIVRTVTNNNVLYVPGTLGVGAEPAADGLTVKMLWVPSRGAIRAGTIGGTSTNWDYVSLGEASSAFGDDNLATGNYSTSLGSFSRSEGQWSFSGGSQSQATNDAAFAFGANTIAGGQNSLALGQNSITTGRAALCCGADGVASGNFSFVANDANVASGTSAAVFGFGSTVRGENAFSAGENNNIDGFDNLGFGNNIRTTNNFTIAIGNGVSNFFPNTVVVGSNDLVSRWSGSELFLEGGMNLNVSGNISEIRTIPYVWPAAQGGAQTFLQNDGTGLLTWSTNAGLLNVTNLLVNGNSIANVRTNQYTTNISGTPVIGSFWFQGTLGDTVTNGSRTTLEYIPSKHSLRMGALGAQASVSNYWDFTNVGVGSVALGSNNLAVSQYSFVQGIFNLIRSNSQVTSITGGSNNVILTNATYSHIGGGDGNDIGDNHVRATIGGGTGNTVDGLAAVGAGSGTIAGGDNNRVRLQYGTVGGGTANDTRTIGGTIAGGLNNVVRDGDYGFLGGGEQNNLAGDWAVIGGGSQNIIQSATTGNDGQASGIFAGRNNTIGTTLTGADYSMIGGGRSNNIPDVSDFAFIGGGLFNQTGGGGNAVNFNAILGGVGNITEDQADMASVGGGAKNRAGADFTFIPGGASNNANAVMASAIGNFITNATTLTTTIGHGAFGGNNRALRVGTNGAVVLNHGGPAAVGGTYLITNTPIASAGASETNLQVVTIGAHVLTNDQERITFRASGNFAATANTKQIKVIFGSETLLDTGAQIVNTGSWVIEGEIIRTGNTSHTASAEYHGAGVTLFTTASAVSLAQTNGIATVLKLTGTAAGDGDITNRTLVVEWHPKP